MRIDENQRKNKKSVTKNRRTKLAEKLDGCQNFRSHPIPFPGLSESRRAEFPILMMIIFFIIIIFKDVKMAPKHLDETTIDLCGLKCYITADQNGFQGTNTSLLGLF
jgi:hypothetical protein